MNLADVQRTVIVRKLAVSQNTIDGEQRQGNRCGIRMVVLAIQQWDVYCFSFNDDLVFAFRSTSGD